jgi:ketosteroid isomerase-like protein
MRLSRLSVAAAVLALSGFACEKKADTAAEEKAIRDQVTAFNAAIVSKNDSLIGTAIYADNATLYPPNEKAVNGTTAIRAFWAMMWPMNANLVITPGAVVVASSGDMATESGTWTFSATMPTGPVSDNGKYLVHWHKLNGTWKIVDDIWNSDNPAVPMPAADSSAAK